MLARTSLLGESPQKVRSCGIIFHSFAQLWHKKDGRDILVGIPIVAPTAVTALITDSLQKKDKVMCPVEGPELPTYRRHSALPMCRKG